MSPEALLPLPTDKEVASTVSELPNAAAEGACATSSSLLSPGALFQAIAAAGVAGFRLFIKLHHAELT